MQSTFILLQYQLLNSESSVYAVISCSYFPIINSVLHRISSLLVLHPILCFLGRYFWSKSPLLSLLGFIFRFYIYHCHHSIQHHFLSITSLFLVVSLLPGCAKFISFFLFVCARIKSFPLLFYSSYVSSN